MFDKIKQLKDLRDQAHQLKTILEQEHITTTAAGGKITLVMNGNQDIVTLDIDETLCAPTHKEDLQNGIKDAYADALRKVHQLMADTMRKTGGLSFPGL